MSNVVANGTGVQSVDRAVSILEILAREGEVGVTDIAAELGVHKSTAFRLVVTLENRGLVEQDTDRGKYKLGVGLLRLAGATQMQLDLVQESRAVTRKLAADVGETINVTVLSDGAALYIDQLAGPSALQIHNWVGQRIPRVPQAVRRRPPAARAVHRAHGDVVACPGDGAGAGA
jgi:DNA-binding IclR family transcriptional regulator